MRRWVRPVLGVVLLAVGALWALQGSNAVGDSGMSGHSQWLVIGLIVAIAGLALLVGGVKKLRAGRR